MPATVKDISTSLDLQPTKLCSLVASLMLGSQVNGCFVLTTQRSKLVAATQKVRASHLHSCNEPVGGAIYFL